MPMSDVLIVGVLASWFVLSCLNQVRRGAWVPGLVRRLDIFRFLPIWTFFAPNPGSTDVRIFFRDHSGHGVGPWRLADRDDDVVRAVRALWNPRKRVRKAISDAVAALESARRRGTPVSHLVVDASYLLLLFHVNDQPDDFATTARQFAISRNVGRDARTNSVILVSPRHAWEPSRSSEAG
jgi:hypothetical protein